MNRFKKIIKNIIKKRIQEYDVIQNINYYKKDQKKVLISYMTIAYQPNFNNECIYHTNMLELQQIIRWFIEKDYSIDLIDSLADVLNYKNMLEKRYDVLFGFGKSFDYLKEIQVDAKKVLYVTENDFDISHKSELQRIEYYKERTGKNVRLVRSGKYYKKDSFSNIDALITLGEPRVFEKYSMDKYYLSPTGLKNCNYKFVDRNFDESKKNFLWFGSNGAIHKGLDLLLDAFKDINFATLHIFGLNKYDKKILKVKEQENIKIYDKVNVQDDFFVEIVNKCSYIFMPSCSEAKSTAVLTCMRHGLIPIVTNTMGFNEYREYVTIIDDFSIDNIKRMIKKSTEIDNEALSKYHKKVFDFSNKYFCLDRYRKDINIILSKILEEN